MPTTKTASVFIAAGTHYPAERGFSSILTEPIGTRTNARVTVEFSTLDELAERAKAALVEHGLPLEHATDAYRVDVPGAKQVFQLSVSIPAASASRPASTAASAPR